jgi:hypothetical protein
MFEIVTDPTVAQGSHSAQTYELAEFPAHRFTELGHPIRVKQSKRGPKAKLGPEEPIRQTANNKWFRLLHASGANRVVSQQTLRGKLFGFGTSEISFLEIPEFPKNLFDRAGNCYRRSNLKPVAYTEASMPNERRYRVWHAKKGYYTHLTNTAIVHYFNGRCDLIGAHLPADDGYRSHDDFLGYGFHVSGDSVVRYFSNYRHIAQVRELKFSNDWSIVVTDNLGRKVRLNKRQIAELAGNYESAYAPEPEPISVCPVKFERSTDPRDLLLPQHVPAYDAEQARLAAGGAPPKPTWPPHLR